MTLEGKTIFVTGASRGIGRAIALRAAQKGARVILAAKTTEPHPHLEGTIYSVAAEITALGGQALPVAVDVRFEDQIHRAVALGVETFGGIDILVNNASAIELTNTAILDMKKYDVMFDINGRGTFATTQACLPYLKKSKNPHVLMLSPPLNLNPHWFAAHTAYTVSKYTMSLWVVGMAAEFRPIGIAVNALWPRTTIATAAIERLGGEKLMRASRTPDIVADAALEILTQDSKKYTGQFLIDEQVLTQAGVHDFTHYAYDHNTPLKTDLFLND